MVPGPAIYKVLDKTSCGVEGNKRTYTLRGVAEGDWQGLISLDFQIDGDRAGRINLGVVPVPVYGPGIYLRRSTRLGRALGHRQAENGKLASARVTGAAEIRVDDTSPPDQVFAMAVQQKISAAEGLLRLGASHRREIRKELLALRRIQAAFPFATLELEVKEGQALTPIAAAVKSTHSSAPA